MQHAATLAIALIAAPRSVEDPALTPRQIKALGVPRDGVDADAAWRLMLRGGRRIEFASLSSPKLAASRALWVHLAASVSCHC